MSGVRKEDGVDGGPAFPTLDPRKYDAVGNLLPRGMSLRDWFAGQALALVVNQNWFTNDFGACADRAYRYADAMLAERAK